MADIERRRENWEAWAAALVVLLAVVIGLRFKGISGETVTDAVGEVASALIPILSAFVAAGLVMRQMDPAERFMRAGEDALSDLQKRNPGILSGPKASHDSYDPDNPGKAGRYLFFQARGQNRKAQFIPALPLRDGIIEIRVSKTTALLLGADQATAEDVRRAALTAIKTAVQTLVERDWPNTHEVLAHKHQDVAIAVNLDESALGLKRYRKAVAKIGNAALQALLKAAKPS